MLHRVNHRVTSLNFLAVHCSPARLITAHIRCGEVQRHLQRPASASRAQLSPLSSDARKHLLAAIPYSTAPS